MFVVVCVSGCLLFAVNVCVLFVIYGVVVCGLFAVCLWFDCVCVWLRVCFFSMYVRVRCLCFAVWCNRLCVFCVCGFCGVCLCVIPLLNVFVCCVYFVV